MLELQVETRKKEKRKVDNNFYHKTTAPTSFGTLMITFT